MLSLKKISFYCLTNCDDIFSVLILVLVLIFCGLLAMQAISIKFFLCLMVIGCVVRLKDGGLLGDDAVEDRYLVLLQLIYVNFFRKYLRVSQPRQESIALSRRLEDHRRSPDGSRELRSFASVLQHVALPHPTRVELYLDIFACPPLKCVCM